MSAFRDWLPGRFIYFSNGPGYEIVIGFRYLENQQEWRIATGSVRGVLTQEAIERGIQQIVDFLNAHGSKSIYAMGPLRDPSHPHTIVLETICDVARENPNIKEVNMTKSWNEERYEIILK